MNTDESSTPNLNEKLFWKCPNCSLPLMVHEKSMRCANGHVFDKAKQGYCNLLLANQKAAKEPGDNAGMIDARRAFLDSGFYQPLVENIGKLIFAKGVYNKSLDNNSISDNSLNLLDLGCGEGYYLNALASVLGKYDYDVSSYGVDISKFANRRAAARYKSAEFAVASTFNLPALDQCVDIALCVFAPLSMSEVRRVLKAESGLFIRVSPGPKHLFQLKQAIYDQVQLHEVPECPEGFEVLGQERLHYELTLNPSDYEKLITMTPLNWHGKEENKTRLLSESLSTVEVDFDIQLYRLSAA